MKLLSLSDSQILFGIHKIDDYSGTLSLQEKNFILGATDKRTQEFSTSRYLAKKLLSKLNYKTTNILSNEFGAPVWPKGIIGSVSHSHDLCIVAISQNRNNSIGIDLQKIIPTKPDFTDYVLTSKEKEQNSFLSEQEKNIAINLIFSIKESLYKSLAHDKALDLDFQDAETLYHDGRFKAKIKNHKTEFEGIYRIYQDYIFTGLLTKTKI